jgi:hypothetical protein
VFWNYSNNRLTFNADSNPSINTAGQSHSPRFSSNDNVNIQNNFFKRPNLDDRNDNSQAKELLTHVSSKLNTIERAYIDQSAAKTLKFQ